MSNPIEQTLSNLLPTLTGALPSPLLDLATSLLAQSRHKASALKPDEEIARVYVCAHVACERLKARLNLPPIDARPPCPPRVYSKLYKFIDQVLPVRTAASEPSTPRKSQHQGQRLQHGASTPKRAGQLARTLGSAGKFAGANDGITSGSTFTRGKRKRGREDSEDGDGDDVVTEDGVPVWVMPLIRHLCRALRAPAAVPHVYAGVCSVLRLLRYGQANGEAVAAWVGPGTPSKKRSRLRRSADTGTATNSYPPDSNPSSQDENTFNDRIEMIQTHQIPALIVTLTLFTIGALQPEGKEITEEEDLEQDRMAVQAVRQMERGRMQSEEELVRSIECFVCGAAGEGWLESEWYENIPSGAGLGAGGVGDWGDGNSNRNGSEDEVDGEEGANDEGLNGGDGEIEVQDCATTPSRTPLRRLVTWKDDGDNMVNGNRLQSGLGTMMQDKVDWLSEERRRDYKVWKKGIMWRIEEIERAGENGRVN